MSHDSVIRSRVCLLRGTYLDYLNGSDPILGKLEPKKQKLCQLKPTVGFHGMRICANVHCALGLKIH